MQRSESSSAMACVSIRNTVRVEMKMEKKSGLFMDVKIGLNEW